MNNQELVENNHQLDNASHRKGQPDAAAERSNEAVDGAAHSPGGANQLVADRKMDDDTGLSNTVNVELPVDEGARQAEQSNVGRRDDMTPD